jgi:hypothetical protein
MIATQPHDEMGVTVPSLIQPSPAGEVAITADVEAAVRKLRSAGQRSSSGMDRGPRSSLWRFRLAVAARFAPCGANDRLSRANLMKPAYRPAITRAKGDLGV